MILSWFTSAGNSLVEKTKNPFLGTFTLVWIARNWELVFALFNFDSSYDLNSKIVFLSERIVYDAFWAEVGWNVFWTFIVLVLTYLLINIARAISNLFEKRLSPIVYKWTDYKSLVPKSEYQNILDRMNDLQERLDKEIQEKLKVQSERDEFEEKYNIQLLEKNELEDSPIPKLNPPQNRSIIEYPKEISDLIGGFEVDDLEYTLNLVKNQNPVWFDTKYEAIAHNLLEKGYFKSQRREERGMSYNLTKKGEELISNLSKKEVSVESTNSTNIPNLLGEEIEKIKSKLLETEDSLRKENEETINSIEKRIIKKYGEELVLETLDLILKGETLEKDSTGYLIASDLKNAEYIEFVSADRDDYYFVSTKLGKELWKKLYK